MLHDNDVERALVVMAHPDDVDFGCAGTVALWTDAGVRVTYLIVTSGDAGGGERGLDGAHMAGLRRTEQRKAAEILNVYDVRFLGYPDGRITPSFELRRDITRVIRQVRPQRMLIPSPERDWSAIAPSHPDHLAVGEAAINAVYPDARNPNAHPDLLSEEGLATWTVPEVWLAHGPSPDHYPDITDVADRRMAALASHTSQIRDFTELDTAMREWFADNAVRAGLPKGRLAERFRVVDTS
ncbi:LmbE family N-acetylglucosaminyl deacetylase [Nocardiopsis mwathae]|uniref:LmbE family N-acetylglucosaminyl deacetylase n=1 Tax=Nocardiopsis mwathae TaxID=1472723 RepID=A0A7W9YIC9_9ACTN|nr:PIG-L deacetylase family protein [Nocardiopsis mwathae]MBB6172720.1 LmbE family N-acetylglucosaminyl deacetylase [Nocardiopsis mwathae]